jgi:hypothetical protein
MPVRYLLLFCVALSVAGCVSQRAVLVNERGEEITCETVGYGVIAGMMASDKEKECIAEAEKRGFHVKEQSR